MLNLLFQLEPPCVLSLLAPPYSMEEYNKDAWQEIVGRCEEVGVDAFEMNFSCPHGMPERKMGAAMGQNCDILTEVRAVQTTNAVRKWGCLNGESKVWGAAVRMVDLTKVINISLKKRHRLRPKGRHVSAFAFPNQTPPLNCVDSFAFKWSNLHERPLQCGGGADGARGGEGGPRRHAHAPALCRVHSVAGRRRGGSASSTLACPPPV